MSSYYANRLAGAHLRRCYEIAPPRIQQYLDAEIEHVAARVRASDDVLELGCGYGRVMRPLGERSGMTIGIDTSLQSLRLGLEYLDGLPRCRLAAMDAAKLGFEKGRFDVVCCVQNGISAFGVDRRALVAGAIRVTRPGGIVLFSTYAERFWDERLGWFRQQAAAGLIGDLDETATGDGVITCKDGFRSTTTRPDEFLVISTDLGVTGRVEVVDGSSVFFEMVTPARAGW